MEELVDRHVREHAVGHELGGQRDSGEPEQGLDESKREAREQARGGPTANADHTSGLVGVRYFSVTGRVRRGG